MTITLIGDITEDVVIPAGEDITIDLAGHKITNVKGHTITNNGTLTIKDSVGGGVVDNVTHARAALYNTGTAVLDGGSFTRSKEAGSSYTDSGGNSYYNIENRGSMTFNEGVSVIQEAPNNQYSSLICNDEEGTGVTMTVNGGTFSGGRNTFKVEGRTTLTINGGTFFNTAQAVLLNWGTTEIDGGTFTADGTDVVGVLMNGCYDSEGKLTINDGTFKGPVGVYEHKQAKSLGTIDVFGGTFDVSSMFDILSGHDASGVSVAGGRFSVEVGNEYLADGYVIVQQADGTYAPVPCYTVTFVVGGNPVEVRVPIGDEITTVPEQFSELDYVWKDTENKVYLVPFTPDDNLTLTGTVVSDSLTVTISVSGSALIGQSVTLTASVGGDVTVSTYAWTLDGVQISGESGKSITVEESGTYAAVITDFGGAVGTASTTLNFVLPTYTVTFVYDGTETPVRVTSGDTAEVPEFEVPEGFELVWMTESGTVWNPSSVIRSDMKLTGELRILAPEVTITQDTVAYTGATVTITATFDEVEGMQYAFLWSTEETTPSIQVTDSDTYTVTVTVSCDGYEGVTASAEVVLEFRLVEVTFDLDGSEKTAETTYGGTVEVPDFGVSDGFHIIWTVDGQPWDGSYTFTGDAIVTGELALDAPVVEILQEGHTITGITVTLTAAILFNDDISYSWEWSTGEIGQSVQVAESGTYDVTVTAQAMYLELEPVATTASVTLEFGEFGFIDDGITVYAGFGPYRPGLISADCMEFSSSDDSVVSVDGNGKLTFKAEDLRRDTVVTITVTAELDGQPLEDTYRMTVLAEHHDMVTGDDHHDPVVSVPSTSDSRDIWNDYLRPEVSVGGLPQTSRNDWTIVDIFIPDDDGHVSEGGEFTVPFDYFGVRSADGYVFHIVHIVGGDVDVLVKDTDFFVEDDGVRIVVGSFSPFAFYAEPEAATPDDPDTPVVPGGDDPSTPSQPSQPSQPSHPGYDDDDEYVPPSGGTIIVTPGGSTTTTTTTDDDDDDMKVAIVACAAVGVLAALIAVFVWTDRKS